MPKVGLVGPYSPAMKEAFYDSLPQDYEAVEVTATDDYKNLADVDYIINRTLPIDETLLSICPKLKFIAKYAVGFDNIDVAAAAQRNIPVTNCKGFNSDSVAELTVALMIDSCRNLYPMYLGLREDNWMQDKLCQYFAHAARADGWDYWTWQRGKPSGKTTECIWLKSGLLRCGTPQRAGRE